MENTNINNIEAMVTDIPMEDVVHTMPKAGKYIGGGLAVGVVALAAVVAKKMYDARKAKKELRQPEEEIVVEPEQVEEVVAK